MIQPIDFLPARYRERSARRQVKLWQLGVLSLFGAVIAAATVGQHFLKDGVQQQVEEIDIEHAVAQMNAAQIERREAQLVEVRADADLYAYLQHRWPGTRILRAIAAAQPRSVTLLELKLSRQARRRQETARGPRRSRQHDETDLVDAGLPKPQRDLKTLQSTVDAGDALIELSGVTSDAAALHRFVADLADVDMFSKAELISFESVDRGSAGRLTEFTVHVILRSSYLAPPPPPAGSKVAGDSHEPTARRS